MKRNIMRLAGALALVTAPISSQALAQVVNTAATTVPFVIEQPANQWLARVFIGQAVHDTAGEVIGDVRDLVFDHQGRISTAIIGVGGFLGLGEKNVGVSFDALTYKVGDKGERVISIALSKEDLVKAPAFIATEKTTFDNVKDEARELGHETADKAVELKDKAVRKYNGITKPDLAK